MYKVIATFALLLVFSCNCTICEAKEKFIEINVDEQVNAIKEFYDLIAQPEIPSEKEFNNMMGFGTELETMLEDSPVGKSTPEGKSVFFNFLRKNKNWFFGNHNGKECEIFISYPILKKDDIVRYEVLTIYKKNIVARIIFSTTRYKNDIAGFGYIQTFFMNNKRIGEIILNKYPAPNLK